MVRAPRRSVGRRKCRLGGLSPGWRGGPKVKGRQGRPLGLGGWGEGARTGKTQMQTLSGTCARAIRGSQKPEKSQFASLVRAASPISPRVGRSGEKRARGVLRCMCASVLSAIRGWGEAGPVWPPPHCAWATPKACAHGTHWGAAAPEPPTARMPPGAAPPQSGPRNGLGRCWRPPCNRKTGKTGFSPLKHGVLMGFDRVLMGFESRFDDRRGGRGGGGVRGPPNGVLMGFE